VGVLVCVANTVLDTGSDAVGMQGVRLLGSSSEYVCLCVVPTQYETLGVTQWESKV
jgi:hypothetical protein